MNKAVVVLATAAIVSFSAIATPALAHTRPWGWAPGIAVGWGPVYGYPGLYAPDALWDAIFARCSRARCLRDDLLH